jgi:putative acetyltransferase
MTTALHCHTVDPLRPDFRALLAASDAHAAALYPAESNHLEPAEALASPHVHVVGGFEGEHLVVTGAVKHMDDDGRYGEIKRVFVDPASRGRGHSRRVMQVLETELVAQGVGCARLETGIHQPEALGLYRSLGYVERNAYGAYRPDPLSVFMEKRLPVLNISELRAGDEACTHDLARLLTDCIEAGASIGWVRVPRMDAALTFWRGVAADVQAGARRTWLARQADGILLGTVSLVLQQPENGALRAELVKLMVHPAARRAGVAQALMHTAEQAAVRLNKHLLLLDTNTDSPAQRLYEQRGWQVCGVMPDYAIQADGSLGATTWMYRRLVAPAAPGIRASSRAGC